MSRVGGLDRARTGCTLVAEWPLAVWAESRPARRQPGEQRRSDARGERRRNRFRRRRRDRDRAAAPPRAAAALRSPVRLPAGGGGGDRREPGQPVADRRWRGDRAGRRRTGAHPRPAQRLSRRSRAELRRLPLPGARRARRRAPDGGGAALRRPALRPPRARGRTRLAPVLALALLQPQEPVRVRQARGRLGDGPDRARHGRAAGASSPTPNTTPARRARPPTPSGSSATASSTRSFTSRRSPTPPTSRPAPIRIRSASTTRTETGPRHGCRSSGSAIG